MLGDVFDTAALRQWEGMTETIMSYGVDQMRILLNQLCSDLVATADHIDELEKERDSWRSLAEGWKLTDDVERHRV